jgi:hypothetical protein
VFIFCILIIGCLGIIKRDLVKVNNMRSKHSAEVIASYEILNQQIYHKYYIPPRRDVTVIAHSNLLNRQ